MFFIHSPILLGLTVLSLLIAAAAQIGVKSAYGKWKKVGSRGNKTGAQIAEELLQGTPVRVVRSQGGELSDHFNPRTNEVALSKAVYDGTSLAALGIAAHEVGHALQYDQSYVPIKIRNGLLPVTQLGSFLAFPLVFAGIFIGQMPFLIDIGIALFMAVLLFQLITLPIELNASRRAMMLLEDGYYLETEELSGARKVLNAAAMTYVAAIAVSLIQLLRLLLIANRR